MLLRGARRLCIVGRGVQLAKALPVCRYGSITIDLGVDSIVPWKSLCPNEISAIVHESLSHVACAWVQVPISLSAVIPILTQNNKLKVHHANEHYIMLSSGGNMPEYASSHVGVGAWVDRDDGKVLVVKERVGGDWKLPGGAVDRGEDLYGAAEREVKEETGIISTAKSVLGFRQWHQYRFGCDDIYFVVRLRAVTSTIQIDDQEIKACRWMLPNDYLNLCKLGSMNHIIAGKAINGSRPHEWPGTKFSDVMNGKARQYWLFQ